MAYIQPLLWHLRVTANWSIFSCKWLQLNVSNTKTDLPISSIKLGENCSGIRWTVACESITFLQRFCLSPKVGFLAVVTSTLRSVLLRSRCTFVRAQAPGVLCSQTCRHCLCISVSGMILEVMSQPGSILIEVCMQITSKPSFPFYGRFLFDWFVLQDLIL